MEKCALQPSESTIWDVFMLYSILLEESGGWWGKVDIGVVVY